MGIDETVQKKPVEEMGVEEMGVNRALELSHNCAGSITSQLTKPYW